MSEKTDVFCFPPSIGRYIVEIRRVDARLNKLSSKDENEKICDYFAYGAHVASQYGTIRRDGKAIMLLRNARLNATPKTQIVLDRWYAFYDNIHKTMYSFVFNILSNKYFIKYNSHVSKKLIMG